MAIYNLVDTLQRVYRRMPHPAWLDNQYVPLKRSVLRAPHSVVCVSVFNEIHLQPSLSRQSGHVERVMLAYLHSFCLKPTLSHGWWRFCSVSGGGSLKVHFMGSGLPTDLFNSSEYTLPELPHQQNQPLTFPPRRACLRIKSRYWDNQRLLECIMYDQIPSSLFSPCASIPARHSASEGLTHPRQEKSVSSSLVDYTGNIQAW